MEKLNACTNTMSREGHSLFFSHQINKTSKAATVMQMPNTLEGH